MRIIKITLSYSVGFSIANLNKNFLFVLQLNNTQGGEYINFDTNGYKILLKKINNYYYEFVGFT